MQWLDFLNDNHIEYVTRGPNTKRGEVSVRCPWCGEDDPSQHLGISLEQANWGCLRNPNHRGRSPAHLISGLLGCSHHQAMMIVSQYFQTNPDAISVVAASEELQVLPEPAPELRPIKPEGGTARFWNYLHARGFEPRRAILEYTLRCCTTGRYKDRIIIPLFKEGEMIAWTGRALIAPTTAPRYLSSRRTKETIFNEDTLFNVGRGVLFVVEGPFDAMKLDHYGWQHGARATCTFGTSMSMDQVALLTQLRHRFDKVVVLFDRDALEPALMASDWLGSGNIKLGGLPGGVKDPGELSQTQVLKLIKQEQ